MNTHVDTAALKRAHPIAEVVARYGVELRLVGRALVGRCPFHPDGGRPNLHVYPQSDSWYCYRCGVGGDAIAFVMRLEGTDFRRAVASIAGGLQTVPHPAAAKPPRLWVVRDHPPAEGAAERACLAAAVEVYARALLADRRALAYVLSRGLDRETVERCRLGYARGDALVPYLRKQRLPLAAAARVGLLNRAGREFFAGRVVVPEVRGGQPLWLVGRALQPSPSVSRYLGLPGPKPLLGWEEAARSTEVWLTEGVFDWLVLVSWGLPALCLVGTGVGASTLRALRRFRRVYLALDDDEVGRRATDVLLENLEGRALAVPLAGAKDVAELALRPGGRATLCEAATGHGLPVAA